MLLEVAAIWSKHQKNPGADLSESFFIWGVLDVFLALTLIFGFENRVLNLNYTKSGNESYVQNTSNFLGAVSKNFFNQGRSLSAGKLIFALGIINLLTYFILMTMRG